MTTAPTFPAGSLPAAQVDHDRLLDELNAAHVKAEIARYATSRAGGGNPEAVIMRAIAAGRNTPAAWSDEFRAARGHGFSGEVAQRLVRGGVLTFDQASGAYGFTAETEAWIVETMATLDAAYSRIDAGRIAAEARAARA